MIDKLNKLSNWLKNNDLKKESFLISDMLSKLGEEVGSEAEDNSSGEYWDFHADSIPSGWSSSVFAPKDLMSRGNSRVRMYKPALRALNIVASKQPGGRAVRLTNQVDSSKNGGYRDKAYNSSVGGVQNSQHIDGKAFDIHVADYSREERLLLLQALVDAGFTGFGHGKNVIHADFGPKRTWTYAGYQKPSEDAYRNGSSSVIVEQSDDLTGRREDRRERREDRRSRSRGCSPPFDETVLDDVRFGEKIQYGSRGPEVGAMQTLLENHGYILAEFGVDCIFKSETKGRLKDFQAASGLGQTGVLDSFTLVELEKAPSAVKKRTPTKSTAKTVNAGSHQMDDKFPEWSRLGEFTKRKSNFHSIGDGKNNYKSANPIQSVDFFVYLKEKYKIKHIINLKSDGGEGRLVGQVPGLTYLSIPLGSSPPDSEEWSRISALLTAGNTLVHCRHGADRTGAVVARWKIENGMSTPDEALGEALSYGFKQKDHKGYKFSDDGTALNPDPNRKLRSYILASEQKRTLQIESKEAEEGAAAKLNGDTIYPIRRNASVDLVVFYHGNTGNKDVLEGLKALDLSNTLFLIPNGEFKNYNDVKATIEQLSRDYGITINNKKLGAWSAGSKGFITAKDEVFSVKMLADPAPFTEIMNEVPSGVYMEYNPQVWGKSSANNLPILARRIEANGGRTKLMSGVNHKAILNSILSQLV